MHHVSKARCGVTPFNNENRKVCRETGAVLIECHNAFIYEDGTTVRHFYNNDGIHLNQNGRTILVFNINKRLQIVKTPRNEETSRQHATTFDDYAGRQYRIIDIMQTLEASARTMDIETTSRQ